MRLFLTIFVIVLGLSLGGARADPRFWKHEFPLTDFAQTTVPDWREIRDGGPGRDGIPALTAPACSRFATSRIWMPSFGRSASPDRRTPW